MLAQVKLLLQKDPLCYLYDLKIQENLILKWSLNQFLKKDEIKLKFNKLLFSKEKEKWYYKYHLKQDGPFSKFKLFLLFKKKNFFLNEIIIWHVELKNWSSIKTFLSHQNKIKNQQKILKNIYHRFCEEIIAISESDKISLLFGKLKKGILIKVLKKKKEKFEIFNEASLFKGWINIKNKILTTILKRIKVFHIKKKKVNWKENKSLSVYVNGLSLDVTLTDIEKYFRRCGIIKRDIWTGKLKIKLYKNKDGTLKGDGIINYFKEESVGLALKILDGAEIIPRKKLSVTRAKWTCKKEFKNMNHKKLTASQRYIAREIYKSYFNSSWDNDMKNIAPKLHIVILKGMYTLNEVDRNSVLFYQNLKMEISEECESFGNLEKITIFKGNSNGVIAIRFKNPIGAKKCIEKMNNRYFSGRIIKCHYWDGETDYRVK